MIYKMNLINSTILVDGESDEGSKCNGRVGIVYECCMDESAFWGKSAS